MQASAGAVWWVAVFTNDTVRTATLGGLDPLIVALWDIPLFVVASAVAAGGIVGAVWVASSWTLIVAVLMAAYATVTTEAGWGALLMCAAAGGSGVAAVLVLRVRLPVERLVSGPFAFRPAGRGRSSRHVAMTGLQLLCFWGVFLLLLPLLVAWIEQRWRLQIVVPDAVVTVGGVVLLAASALGVWSAVTMSTRGEGTPLPAVTAARLVVTGPYRFVRNPMAVAGIVQGVAVGLILSSWLVVLYALAGSLLWNGVIRPLEEADLETRFGEEFRRYRDRVSCWVPRRPG